MRHIFLISCSAKKSEFPQPAEHLYTSPLFRFSLAYAKLQNPDAIYILSAKHGLVSCDTILEPYNESLNTHSKSERRSWSDTVLDSLREVSDLTQDHYTILAGKNYTEFLVPHLTHHSLPLSNLPLGKRIAWLKKALIGYTQLKN